MARPQDRHRLGALLQPHMVNAGGRRVLDDPARLRRRHDDQHGVDRFR
jgi:hypothetical protein